VGVELFYPEIDNDDKIHTQQAINVCKICPHLAECAEWGINRERFGTWGGIPAPKRRKIRIAKGITLPREEHFA
jgi:hypothetical protein